MHNNETIEAGYTDGDGPTWPDGRPEVMLPVYSGTSLDDGSIIADCPRCHDPMLLGEAWRELIDEGYEVPACPDCEPDEWADGADPKISGLEVAALAQ